MFRVLGIYTILHLQSVGTCWLNLFMSLFSSYCREGKSELSCVYEHFCLFWKLFSSHPVVSPTVWRPFSPLLTRMFSFFQLKGNSCYVKGIGKAANPNWYKRFLLWRFTVNVPLRVCWVRQYCRWQRSLQTDRSSNWALSYESSLEADPPTVWSVRGLLRNLPELI